VNKVFVGIVDVESYHIIMICQDDPRTNMHMLTVRWEFVKFLNTSGFIHCSQYLNYTV